MAKENFMDGLKDLSLTRRDFLKGLAAAGLLGGSMGSGWSTIGTKAPGEQIPEGAKPIPPVSPGRWDRETDVLIIGYGIGGAQAALAVHEKGAKMIILEKAPDLSWGGRGVRGPIIFGAKLWEEATGLKWDEETREKVVESSLAAAFHVPDRRLLRRALDACKDAVEATIKTGVKFGGIPMLPGGMEAGAVPPVAIYVKATDLSEFTPRDPWLYKWLGVQRTIERHLKKANVEFMVSTKAESLATDRTGGVVGVKASGPEGKPIYLKAKSVVICTGGYGANYDMIKHYGYLDEVAGFYMGSRYNSGDGIRMAQGVGADIIGLPCGGFTDGGIPTQEMGLPWAWDAYEYDGETICGLYQAAVQLGRQPVLKVNVAGRRFMNEDQSWTAKVNHTWMQPGHVLFAIYDGDIEKNIEVMEGARYGWCEQMIRPTMRVYYNDDDIRPLFDWRDSFKRALDDGLILKAETLRELAKKLGIDDVKQFLKTVKEYNAAVDKGVDERFGKNPGFLFPVRKPPFYGMKRKPGIITNTVGGIRINENTEVLTAKGRPIPGLYAGSVVCSGLSAEYDRYALGGAAAAFALGRIAGEDAAASALEK